MCAGREGHVEIGGAPEAVKSSIGSKSIFIFAVSKKCYKRFRCNNWFCKEPMQFLPTGGAGGGKSGVGWEGIEE